ncbi:hypothetical protein CBR_g22199 [Chara braunii]|uniref:Uncharacterized protein n=1 Tax=Chara braunii TaxID=69332 RepID=A0A388L2C7_CHABU|nr:hypothetical protein CBR_g22199 [Chara braunii]|eukprot:GBG76451.1 hypothetical protein CBR_g22199 [Chara braunii]
MGIGKRRSGAATWQGLDGGASGSGSGSGLGSGSGGGRRSVEVGGDGIGKRIGIGKQIWIGKRIGIGKPHRDWEADWEAGSGLASGSGGRQRSVETGGAEAEVGRGRRRSTEKRGEVGRSGEKQRRRCRGEVGRGGEKRGEAVLPRGRALMGAQVEEEAGWEAEAGGAEVGGGRRRRSKVGGDEIGKRIGIGKRIRIGKPIGIGKRGSSAATWQGLDGGTSGSRS